MLISHKHKFIYFKPMKVAGTSIQYFLENFCGEDGVVSSIVPVELSSYKPRNNKNGLNYSHIPPAVFFDKHGSAKLEKYRIICSSRNSWDRVVSMYSMIKFSEKRPPVFKDWLLRESKKTIGSHPKDSKNVSQLPHYIYSFSYFNGGNKVDNWIRQESLEEDLRAVCSSLGIDHENINLLHTKHYNKKHYTEYYDDETREIVAEKYAKDIEYFGYKFE